MDQLEEQNLNSVSSKPAPSKKTVHVPATMIVVVVVIAIAAFVGGTQYEKSHLKTDASNNKFSSLESSGRFPGGGNNSRVFGTVSAISSSSISIDNSRSGSTSTLSITSSTTITDAGQSSSISDIQTGDTVIATKTSASSSTAASIEVNPSLPGGGGFGGGASSSGASSSGVSSSGEN